jgi:hypothetical protein
VTKDVCFGKHQVSVPQFLGLLEEANYEIRRPFTGFKKASTAEDLQEFPNSDDVYLVYKLETHSRKVVKINNRLA